MMALERASTPIRRLPTSEIKGLNASDLEFRDTAETRSGEVTIYSLVLRIGRVNMGSLTLVLYVVRNRSLSSGLATYLRLS